MGASTIVAIDGVVDLSSVATLHHDLARTVRDHRGTTIVVDLDGVSALDDTGLGILLGAAAAARSSGGELEVVCSRPPLRDRLELTGFDRAVTVRASIS